MTDETERLVPRLTTEQYDALKERGLNPTVHDPDGNFIGQKPMIDQLADKEVSGKKKSEPEVKRALLNKLGEDTYVVLLNVASLHGLRRAVERIEKKMYEAWSQEKLRRDNLVIEAAQMKLAVPDNYWQAEYHARMRLETSHTFLTMIEEMLKEEEEDVKTKYGKDSSVDGIARTKGRNSETPKSDPGVSSP
jgi:hypothetical protein